MLHRINQAIDRYIEVMGYTEFEELSSLDVLDLIMELENILDITIPINEAADRSELIDTILLEYHGQKE